MIYRKGEYVAWVSGEKILGVGYCLQKSQDGNRQNLWTIRLEDDSIVTVPQKNMRKIKIIKNPNS